MILDREFYARPTVQVARDLLGKVLAHDQTSGIIVETEAYLGGDDLASHSAAGYVYLSYGMHECLNIVAERDGVPGCVLIRALEPLDGIDLMRARRPGAKKDRDLTSGPGKLTRALGITRANNGADMTRGPLVVCTPNEAPSFEIEVSPRIGITKCADLPLRFTIAGNPFVSR